MAGRLLLLMAFANTALAAELRLQDEHLLAQSAISTAHVQAAECRGHLLVVWRDGEAIASALDGRRITIADASAGGPAVACGRDAFLVVWPRSQPAGVEGTLVSIDGIPGATLAIARSTFGVTQAAVAYGGETFLTTWDNDGDTIRAARMNDAGVLLDPTPIGIGRTGFFRSPRVAWTGTNFFLAWSEQMYANLNPGIAPPPPTRIWGTRVSSQGTVIDPVAVPMIESGAGLWGLQISLTATGNRLTVAWVAEHGAQTCVDIAQVTESREPVAGPSHIRCSGDGSGDGIPVRDEAEVRWSRSELVLVWRELMSDYASVLRLARLSASATPKDTPPFAFLTARASSAWAPGLASLADGVGVVYYRAMDPPNTTGVGIFERIVQQGPTGRRRAVGH